MTRTAYPADRPGRCRFVRDAGNVSDRDGGKVLHRALMGLFTHLAHLFIDGGYKGKGVEWSEETLGWSVGVVQHPCAGRSGYPKGRS